MMAALVISLGTMIPAAVLGWNGMLDPGSPWYGLAWGGLIWWGIALVVAVSVVEEW